jgi:hypothetical protein
MTFKQKDMGWTARGQHANEDKFYQYIQSAHKITLWDSNKLNAV